jgi:hypothetical protein
MMSVLSRDDIRNIGEVVAQAVLEALEKHDENKATAAREARAVLLEDLWEMLSDE